MGQAGIDALQVKVKSTVPGSPAEGVLKAGDVITALDGKPVSTRDDVVADITDLPPGTPVKITFERDGTTQTATVTHRG